MKGVDLKTVTVLVGIVLFFFASHAMAEEATLVVRDGLDVRSPLVAVDKQPWPHIAEDQTQPPVAPDSTVTPDSACEDTGCPGYTICTLQMPQRCVAYSDPLQSCTWVHILGACLCSNCM